MEKYGIPPDDKSEIEKEIVLVSREIVMLNDILNHKVAGDDAEGALNIRGIIREKEAFLMALQAEVKVM